MQMRAFFPIICVNCNIKYTKDFCELWATGTPNYILVRNTIKRE